MVEPAKIQVFEGQIVDVVNRSIFPGKIELENGKIKSVTKDESVKESTYILPGFIDAHVHIESSMLVPTEFARLAVRHGTVATVSDPHEIANVLGIPGVEFMINNGKKTNFKFYFGASPCVPATVHETAGARLSIEDIRALFQRYNLHYLSQVMNYSAVLKRDHDIMGKIAVAKLFKKPVDGHAPGLLGADALKYIQAGISTDHECTTLEEALDKLKAGMLIQIREGTAAKNFDALHSLLKSHPGKLMFCSDDKHPDELSKGHINELVIRAIAKGYNLFDVLDAASVCPVKHYKMDVGLLQNGDPADFIIVKDLKDFEVIKTVINGQMVAENGNSLLPSVPVAPINHFNVNPKVPEEFQVIEGGDNLRVILVFDGKLITGEMIVHPKRDGLSLLTDIEEDILKITVVNRYRDVHPAVAFIHGFGLKKGAIASSISHDSHNIIAVGVNDKEICAAVNGVIKNKGGIAIALNGKVDVLPLPIAGIMSTGDGFKIGEEYSRLDNEAKKLGSTLTAPFLSLSYMANLMYPSLKISDKGLFDVINFRIINLIEHKVLSKQSVVEEPLGP